jgi:hypothetical protein
MKFDLFQEVVINRDFPLDNLTKGDIAILNDYVMDRSGQEGCVLEIYTAAGVFVNVVTLPAESIEPLQESDRLSVRKLITDWQQSKKTEPQQGNKFYKNSGQQ